MTTTAYVDKRYHRNGVPFYIHRVYEIKDGLSTEVAKRTSDTYYSFAVYVHRDYRWKFTNTPAAGAVPIIPSF